MVKVVNYILSYWNNNKNSLVLGSGTESMENLASWLGHVGQQQEEKQQLVGSPRQPEALGLSAPGIALSIQRHFLTPGTTLETQTPLSELGLEHVHKEFWARYPEAILWKLTRTSRVACRSPHPSST